MALLSQHLIRLYKPLVVKDGLLIFKFTIQSIHYKNVLIFNVEAKFSNFLPKKLFLVKSSVSFKTINEIFLYYSYQKWFDVSSIIYNGWGIIIYFLFSNSHKIFQIISIELIICMYSYGLFHSASCPQKYSK